MLLHVVWKLRSPIQQLMFGGALMLEGSIQGVGSDMQCADWDLIRIMEMNLRLLSINFSLEIIKKFKTVYSLSVSMV
jgi:hypothetical protein